MALENLQKERLKFMLKYEGERVPLDIYTINTDDLPPQQREIFRLLQPAAQLGGDLYVRQRRLLQESNGKESDNLASIPLVTDPLAVPEESGRFVYLWDHPDLLPYLQQAQAQILEAAGAANRAGDGALGSYLYTLGTGITQPRYDEIYESYLSVVSRINFHLLPIETEFGDKRMWQGFLGIEDKEETRELRRDVQVLRDVGMRRNGGTWFTPRTDIRVDNVAVMSGFLSSRGFTISAENIPNEPHLAGKYGTRLMVFSFAFAQALGAIEESSRPFMSILPKRRGTLRFLTGHELVHDERYDNHLDWLQEAVRESYANQRAIDYWTDESVLGLEPNLLKGMIRGGLGYAFRDCSDILSQGTTPDLETMVNTSRYIPGNLSWLHVGIQEGAFRVQGDVIVDIDLARAIDVSARLANAQQEILQKGTVRDARDHFEGILPKRPLLRQMDSDHLLRPVIVQPA